MVGYIKHGSIVGQDFRFFEWTKPEQYFNLEKSCNGRYKCVAHGYGVLDTGESYGNGSIYTLIENVVITSHDPVIRETDFAY